MNGEKNLTLTKNITLHVNDCHFLYIMQNFSIPSPFEVLNITKRWENVQKVIKNGKTTKISIHAIGPFLYFYEKGAIAHIVFIPTATNGTTTNSRGSQIKIDSLGKVFQPISISFNSHEDMKEFRHFFDIMFAKTGLFFQNLDMLKFVLVENMKQIMDPKTTNEVVATIQIVARRHHFQAPRIFIAENKPFTEKLTQTTLVYPDVSKATNAMPASCIFSITDMNNRFKPNSYLCSTPSIMMKWVLAIYIAAVTPDSDLQPKIPKAVATVVSEKPAEAPKQPSAKPPLNIVVETNVDIKKKNQTQEKPTEAKPAEEKPVQKQEQPVVEKKRPEIIVEKIETPQNTENKPQDTSNDNVQKKSAAPKLSMQINVTKTENLSQKKKPELVINQTNISIKKNTPAAKKEQQKQIINNANVEPEQEDHYQLPQEVVQAGYSSPSMEQQLNNYMNQYAAFQKKRPDTQKPTNVEKKATQNTYKYDQNYINDEITKLCVNFDKLEHNFEFCLPISVSSPDLLVKDAIGKITGDQTIDLSKIFDFSKFGMDYELNFSATAPQCPLITELSNCSQEFFATGKQIQSDSPAAYKFVFLIASIFLNGLNETSLIEPIKELAFKTPELNLIVVKIQNITDVSKQATTMSAILINEKVLSSVFNSILRMDNWSEKYYKRTAMIRNETALEEALTMVDAIINSQQFIIDADHNIMSEIPSCDKTRFVDTPIFSYLDMDEFKSNPAKNAEYIFTTGIMQKKNFLQQYSPMDPFDCIAEVSGKLQENELTSSFLAAFKKLQNVSVLGAVNPLKANKVLETMWTTKLSQFLEEGIKTRQIYKWLCILVAHHNIICEWYNEESILRDFFRAKFVISQVYLYEKE